MTVLNEVIEIVADVLELETDEVTAESTIVSELGADSLDIVDLSFSLGKKFSIKMPQKTVMMHAEVIVEDANLLVSHGRLTELGAELLRQGPNNYTDSEVSSGMTLIDIFAETKVIHWANLCQGIIESGTHGDELIKQKVQSILVAQAN